MIHNDGLTKAEEIENMKRFIGRMRLLFDALEEDIDDDDEIANYMALWTACELHDWLLGFKAHINNKFQEVRSSFEKKQG